MFLGVGGVGEASGGLDDNLRAHGFPRQRGRVFFFENLDHFAVDGNAVGSGGDGVGQIAENRVVFQQVSQRLGIGQIVDRHELDVLVLERGAQDVAADAAKSINPYFYSHVSSER